MIKERWEIYKAVQGDACEHAFYAGALAMHNEITPIFKRYMDVDIPPNELLLLFDEILRYIGKDLKFNWDNDNG